MSLVARYTQLIFIALALACSFLPAHAGSMAHDMVKAGDLVISDAQTAATPPGAQVAVGYLKIENHGSEDDVLQSISAGFAEVAEFHTMEMKDDVMKMRKLAEPVVIEAGGEFVFSAGAEHVMFMELKQSLVAGDVVDVTLSFEKAGEVDVQMKVMEPGMAGGMEHGGGMKMEKKSP